MDSYSFTNDWFKARIQSLWSQLLSRVKPTTLLEIGSYEGASACFLIEFLGATSPIELHCVDTWEGSLEHKAVGDDMAAVEQRFHANIAIARGKAANPVDLVVHKGRSDEVLAHLIVEGKRNHFDFVYVDGSHQAPDVLVDAALAFKLVRVGGVIAFDDYLWTEKLPSGRDPLRCPKPAIDAFVNLFFHKVRVLNAPLTQLYVQKLAD
ncbi:MAG: class I SAM-dependent methyltransferase [Alphaproteobacteria bacterium]|nr:class I SAM-dependent methyltransferase [Alphaproteobacteria bacterium]